MAQKAREIVQEIVKYVGDDDHGDWYAGIAKRPRKRLFDEHSVKKKKGKWIHRTAKSDKSARKAEEALHRQGFKGNSGGGDRKTTSVYAYKVTPSTIQ